MAKQKTSKENEMKALAAMAEIVMCRKKYSYYVEYAHRPQGFENEKQKERKKSQWIKTRHLEYVCDKIQDFVTTDTGHAVDILILQMPPQHGKSMSITETLPSWYMGKYPDNRIILASYNDDTAERFCRRNKEKIRENGKKIWDIQIGEVDRATEFELSGHQGRCISRGIMAGITSNAANLILIDDPVKNRQEADSEAYRDRQWDEWLNTLKTRLSPSAKVIIIMTRWHEDDLAGRIIANEKNVTVINLPCEAESNDPLGRKVGEALAPELRKGNEWLKEFKEGYRSQEGSRAWQALFQGHPTSAEGGLIQRKWWKYYDIIPDYFDEMIQSWDCTFKDADTSDFVVGQVWGRIGGVYYLVDQIRQRMDIVATMQAIENMSIKYPKSLLKLIEDKANGSAVISMLKYKVHGIVPVNPSGGKSARVAAISPAIEAGNVYLPKDAYWIGEFVEECSSFPTGTHDDQVDAMSQALNRLIYNTKSKYKAPDKFPLNSLEQRIEKQLEKLTTKKKRGVIPW